jgi:hypothetical protein
LTNTISAPPPPDLPLSSVPPPLPLPEIVDEIDPGTGGGGGCFLKATKIRLVDGNFRKIEELKVGDKLASYDITGLNPNVEDSWRSFQTANLKLATAETTIKTLLVNQFNRYFLFELGNGTTLRVTYEHLILTQRNWLWKFLPAIEVKTGDNFLVFPGAMTAPVVGKHEVVANIATYNLDVEPFDIYVADTVIVHNVQYKF